MNALFELVGTTVTEEEYKELMKSNDFSDCSIEEIVTTCLGHERRKYSIAPNYDSKQCVDWVKSIKFAKITYDDSWWDEDFSKRAILRSTRTEEDELQFLYNLSQINYDSGYGGQELFGIIVFKDCTWLERHEYDGSEWWERKELPLEEDYFKD